MTFLSLIRTVVLEFLNGFFVSRDDIFFGGVKHMTKDVDVARASFHVKIASLSISTDSIVTVLQYAMEAVEATTLSGADKKNAVMELVKDVVTDAPIDAQTQSILLEMIQDGIVGHTIDIIVAASRGKVHLNGMAQASQIVCTNLLPYIGKCMTCCFPCKQPTID